jgi:DNA-binding winged helix-turn-helix (wHTH) protein
VTTVLLIGFGHPESIRFLEEMKSRAPQHIFLEPADISEEALRLADQRSSVALIWCPRSSDAASSLIEEAVASGLPTLALLKDHDPPQIDFSGGHVEISFAPANAAEILARIELVLARARGPREKNLIIHGDLVIDRDRYEVRLAGRTVNLTYKEYELLKYISARPGRVFSREALLRAVWDYDYFGGTRTVDVHVRRLRSKINDVRYQFIETIWNVGYRFRSTGDSEGV